MTTAMQKNNEPSVREKLETSLSLLKTIPDSGYWPYASPAPCSTEVKIKDNLNKAIMHLESALEAHKAMFGKREGASMSAPSTTITTLSGS